MHFSEQTTKNTDVLAKEFFVNSAQGLAAEEILKRRKNYGLNELQATSVRPWKILLRQFKSSFIYLLFAAALLSFALGEFIEGWAIVLFLLINAGLGFYQEYRSEQTVELLKKYITARTKVRRDGVIYTIPTKDLVPGDIVLVEAGDSIPADLRILTHMNLLINEEPLTGESIAVLKESTPLAQPATQFHTANNIAFCGTTVTAGSGTGLVFATGTQTAIGGIAQIAGEVTRTSKFEKELEKFSRFILYLVVGTLIFIFATNLLLKGWDTNVAELAVFSIALAVSVIPEALPVVMTFALSRGARRLAKKHVVVKRLSSIEDLGGIEILCTDKTGTLTENKLTVHQTYISSSAKTTSEVLFAGNMGGSYLVMKDRNQGIDPFDTALWEALSPEDRERIKSYRHLNDIPFDPVRKKKQRAS